MTALPGHKGQLMVVMERIAWTTVIAGVISAMGLSGRTSAETLLLAKWDDETSVDATYSLFGRRVFDRDPYWFDHPIHVHENNQGRGAHGLPAGGKWGGGLCCLDADNAKTNGNGDGVSRVCGGWFSVDNNWNLHEGTIEFWFKPSWDPQSSEGDHTLFTTGGHIGPGTGDQDNIRITWYWNGAGDGCLQASWTSYTGTAETSFIILGEHLLDEGHFARDTWHHLAISWNPRRGRFFVDGRRAMRHQKEQLDLREQPEGRTFILGGQGSSAHVYPPSAPPANGTYDNFRVSARMLYDPDKDFVPPGDFPVPRPPKELTLDLGDGVKMQLLFVEPGEFEMGSRAEWEDDNSVGHIRITRRFYMGRYEVTQAQWEAVMGHNRSHRKHPELPADSVSWHDCQEFLRRLRRKTGNSYVRLPTEAQWEYAAGAGGPSHIKRADDEPRLDDAAWYEANSVGTSHPVGQKKPNPWGLHDMLGNVQEWCHDSYRSDHRMLDSVDPRARGTGVLSGHVLKGGHWGQGARACRPRARAKGLPDVRARHTGLRCAIGPRLWDIPTRHPLVHPIIVWGDAGGGEVYALAENCLPNIEHAMTLGLTGIEIDLRPTADGHIVLWHNKEVDDRFYLAGGGRPRTRQLSDMSLDEVKRLRFRTIVNRREQELQLLSADEVMATFKDQTNFLLDVKSVPIDAILDLIARHQSWDRVIVGSFSLDALRQVKATDSRIAVELMAGMLGDRAILLKTIEDLSSIGGEMLSCDGWRDDMVALCHEHGIAVRIWGGTVGFSDARQFLSIGVDSVNGDHPQRMLDAVERLWGKRYLPRKGQTIHEILKKARHRHQRKWEVP